MRNIVVSVLTDKKNARLLKRLNPKDIAEKWKKTMSIDVGDDFKELNVIEYWKCEATGFCWYSPESAAGGDELYAQLEKFDWYYMPDKWEFFAALKMLESNSSVLEVGVGEGDFLKYARSNGHRVVGVELNSKAAERVRSLGFDIHEINLDDLSNRTDELFDVVCAFQVLEHVPAPQSFLEGMIRLLRPGGKLILSVPNVAVIRKIDQKYEDLLNQPPHHMGHWDESVFYALEKLLPVKVKSVHREPLAKYHIRWIVNGYLRSLLNPLGKTIPRLLINRYSTLPIQWLMRAGLRNFFPGHTLLVELEYNPI